MPKFFFSNKSINQKNDKSYGKNYECHNFDY